MDATAFDRLVRSFASSSRRRLVASLSAVPFIGIQSLCHHDRRMPPGYRRGRGPLDSRGIDGSCAARGTTQAASNLRQWQVPVSCGGSVALGIAANIGAVSVCQVQPREGTIRR